MTSGNSRRLRVFAVGEPKQLVAVSDMAASSMSNVEDSSATIEFEWKVPDIVFNESVLMATELLNFRCQVPCLIKNDYQY